MADYRVAVSIILANGVSPILSVIGRDLLGLDASVKKIEGNFHGWTKALVGVGAVLAGSKIMGAMVELTKHASEFNEQLIKMKRLGGEAGEAATSGRLTAKAFDIAQRVPMKVADLMKIPGVTYGMMGMHEADESWESLAKYAYVLRADRHYQGDVTKDLQKLIRAGDFAGRINDPVTKQIDPQRLQAFLDQAAKIYAATHGMVGPDQMLNMALQAGPALRGLTDQGFLSMAVQSQMMGGHRAGTAYLSLWQQLAGGTMMKRTAEGLQEFGLLKPDEWSSEGGHVTISKEASKRLGQLVAQDPMNLAQKINEELAKRGITDPIEQMQSIMRITGRQTTQRFTMEEVAAFAQIKSELDRLNKGLGNGDAFKLLQDESVQANLNNLSSAWDNFLVAMAGPNSQNLIAILQTLTSAVNAMTRAVSGLSVGQINAVYSGIAIFAGALMAIGGALLLTLVGVPATIAAAVAGITALIGVLGTLAIVHWDKITAAFNGIYAAIAGFIDKIVGIASKIGGAFKNPGTDGDSVGKGLNQPMNFIPNQFDPGGRGAPKQQLALSLNLDGRTLAQAVSDELSSMYAFSTGAAAPDGSGRHFGGDHQFSAT